MAMWVSSAAPAPATVRNVAHPAPARPAGPMPVEQAVGVVPKVATPVTGAPPVKAASWAARPARREAEAIREDGARPGAPANPAQAGPLAPEVRHSVKCNPDSVISPPMGGPVGSERRAVAVVVAAAAAVRAASPITAPATAAAVAVVAVRAGSAAP